MLRLFILAASVVTASAAFADQPAGTACAGGLDAESKVIYDAVAPQVTPSTNLRDVVTSTTRSLVIKGEVQRSSAKTSAEAAGTCLEKLKS
jgi:hypothetical protein